jgi:septal ring factor EnvC (AmiA/AmiB activator)
MKGRANHLRPALFLCLLLSVASAGSDDLNQERAAVRQQLSAERAALTAAREQRIRALEALELVERLSRAATVRAQSLRSQLQSIGRRAELLRTQRAAARQELLAQLQSIQPRLFLLYRLTRAHPLQALLSAADFASMMWRWRAMAGLLSRDLETLANAKRLSDFEELLGTELEGLERDLVRWRSLADARAAEADARREELARVVAALSADAVQSKRIVAELEEEERALTQLIKGLQLVRSSGFAALKGRLPPPVGGTVEVGFGKVVNPKFNTVTAQKGWDIRAPEGLAVTAVAKGQVVYAGWLRGYGNVLIVDHGGGFHSLVAHLGSLSRGTGEAVEAGEQLGTVGDTGSLKGPFLYFEIRQDGEAIDPAPWVRDGGAQARQRRGAR